MAAVLPRVRPLIVFVLTMLLVACFAVGSPISAQSPGSWRALFNGKDLTGWSPAGTAEWKVENGVIVGGQGAGRGSLVSTDHYKDFELELEFLLAEHEKYNSGITFRTGYQVNLGRHEAGEFIGVVVHRKVPGAIGPQGNVLWLDKGDEKFPNLRRKEEWNALRIAAKGPHIEVFLNGQKICDVTDDPSEPAEAKWREAGPITFQWPPAGEGGGFDGFVRFRNIRIREL
jgi:hypothetical protein